MFKIKNSLILSLLLFTSVTFATNVDETKVICSEIECFNVIKTLGAGAFGKVLAVENAEGQKFAVKIHHKDGSAWESTSWDSSSWDSSSWDSSSWDSSTWDTSSWDSYYDSDYYASGYCVFDDFQREFQRGQVLDHPHIIKSVSLFSTTNEGLDNMECLMLQYVDGNTVYNTPNKTLSGQESKKAVADAFKALRYAMRQGYFHLDLHTNNMMLDHNNEIKIVDLASFFSKEEIFGYAKKKALAPKNLTKEKLTIREKKLENFFGKNPKLLADLQNHEGMTKRSFAGNESYIDPHQALFYTYYFVYLSEMTGSILYKSDLSKAEIILINQEMMRIALLLSEKSYCDGLTFDDIDETTEGILMILQD